MIHFSSGRAPGELAVAVEVVIEKEVLAIDRREGLLWRLPRPGSVGYSVCLDISLLVYSRALL